MKNSTSTNSASDRIELSQQWGFTVDEAALYFRIGTKCLRKLISANPNANFILRIGTRTILKKQLLADFLDNCSAL